jgi:uncharacterized C2H2 Zn-finger protein
MARETRSKSKPKRYTTSGDENEDSSSLRGPKPKKSASNVNGSSRLGRPKKKNVNVISPETSSSSKKASLKKKTSLKKKESEVRVNLTRKGEKCKWCNFVTYEEINILYKHVQEEHTDEMIRSWQKNDTYIGAMNNTFLHQHPYIQQSEKSEKCSLCPALLPTLSELQKHLREFHIKQCNLCYVRMREDILDDHIEHCKMIAKLDDVQFICRECGQIYKEKQLLIEHTLTAHPRGHKIPYGNVRTDKPLKAPSRKEKKNSLSCNQCNVVFRDKKLKSEHIRLVHSNEGNCFLCEVCHCVFDSIEIKNEHYAQVHAAETNRPEQKLDIHTFVNNPEVSWMIAKAKGLLDLELYERNRIQNFRSEQNDEQNDEEDDPEPIFNVKVELTEGPAISDIKTEDDDPLAIIDQNIKCKHCPREFPNVTMLEVHLSSVDTNKVIESWNPGKHCDERKSHTPDPEFDTPSVLLTCPQCNHAFANFDFDDYADHTKKCHPVEYQSAQIAKNEAKQVVTIETDSTNSTLQDTPHGDDDPMMSIVVKEEFLLD